MISPVIGLPGVGAALTATPREVLAGNAQFAQYLPGVKVIDGQRSRNALNTGQTDVLWAGTLFGIVTASRKFAPSILGVTSAAASAGATAVSVSPATAAEVARRVGSSGTAALKLVGPPSAGGVVAVQGVNHSAVDPVGGTITVSALGAAVVAGSLLMPADGSESIRTILANRWGVKVTDYTGLNSTDVLEEQFLLSGHVRTAAVVNYPLDASLAAWIKNQLRALAPGLTFDDDWL